MAIQETDYGDLYGNQPQNYLLDWARRTGNVATRANYIVEDRLDGSTGRTSFRIRDAADASPTLDQDGANPQPINLSTNDPAVAVESQLLT